MALKALWSLLKGHLSSSTFNSVINPKEKSSNINKYQERQADTCVMVARTGKCEGMMLVHMRIDLGIQKHLI